MGAAFGHSGQREQSGDHLRAGFSDRRRNMDQIANRDQGTDETVDFTWRHAPKKAKSVLSARKVIATIFCDS